MKYFGSHIVLVENWNYSKCLLPKLEGFIYPDFCKGRKCQYVLGSFCTVTGYLNSFFGCDASFTKLGSILASNTWVLTMWQILFKHFKWISLFTLHKILKWVLLYFPFYRWRNHCIEKISNFPKVTQLRNSWAWIQTHSLTVLGCFQSSPSPPLILCFSVAFHDFKSTVTSWFSQ